MLRLPGMDGHARWKSRVRGLPETLGDLPAACLAEEIETPGAGQVRALVCYAGNPVLSTPNGRLLAAALRRLEFMVAVDLYVNETTRHADLILPPAWALAQDHVDLLFPSLAVRNTLRYSPPVVEKGPDERHDWEILLSLAEELGGGPTGTRALDALLRAARGVGFRFTPTKLAELLLRTGARGDRFLPWRRRRRFTGFARLAAEHPHGVDLGALEPGVARRVFHRGGRIQLNAPPLLAALDLLVAELPGPVAQEGLLLVGRRDVRSNNTWLHNLPSLASGRERCLLFVHPKDAGEACVRDGEEALLESRVHRGAVKVRVTEEVQPGIVSLPHGWGHRESARWQRVAGRRPGVSANDWTDDAAVESVVGQSILNGVPVRLAPLPGPAGDAAA